MVNGKWTMENYTMELYQQDLIYKLKKNLWKSSDIFKQVKNGG